MVKYIPIIMSTKLGVKWRIAMSGSWAKIKLTPKHISLIVAHFKANLGTWWSIFVTFFTTSLVALLSLPNYRVVITLLLVLPAVVILVVCIFASIKEKQGNKL
jgi:hypothetical protein